MNNSYQLLQVAKMQKDEALPQRNEAYYCHGTAASSMRGQHPHRSHSWRLSIPGCGIPETNSFNTWTYTKPDFLRNNMLVGGAITILKNDGVRQWEGWHPQYMKWEKNVWNHQPVWNNESLSNRLLRNMLGQARLQSKAISFRHVYWPAPRNSARDDWPTRPMSR